METGTDKKPSIGDKYLLLFVISIVAICGIVYELLISTAASYLLGDSIKQFSIIIGIYMSSMGLGAYLSKYIGQKLIERFIQIELLLSFVGGLSVLIIFLLFSGGGLYYYIVLYGLTVIIGMFVGFEIPLVIRIMENILELKENVANVLAFDYIGGLIGSVAFPLLFLPVLGIMKTSLLIGLLNLLSALWLIIRIKNFSPRKTYLTATLLLLIALSATFINAKSIDHYLEQNFYKDTIVISKQTPYQKLVVTRFKNDIRLFIDGNLQFSSMDEYRYHEGLVHIPIAFIPVLKNVLILGGGDGLVARELLKYRTIESITLVDLDKEMTEIFSKTPELQEINNDSLNNDKVKVVNKDAMKYLEDDKEIYDFIIIDLPDPRTPELSKLYSVQFYELVKRHLSRTGIIVTQATSPYFSKTAFWCIVETLSKVFTYTNQYHINVLTFGDWGFALGSNLPIENEKLENYFIPVETKFLTSEVAQTAFVFGKDSMKPGNIRSNSIFDPIIIQYYNKSWEKW